MRQLLSTYCLSPWASRVPSLFFVITFIFVPSVILREVTGAESGSKKSDTWDGYILVGARSLDSGAEPWSQFTVCRGSRGESRAGE